MPAIIVVSFRCSHHSNYDVCVHTVKHDHYDDEEIFLKAIGEKVASSIQER